MTDEIRFREEARRARSGGPELRDELVTRIAYASNKDRAFSERRHRVPPV